VAATLRRTRDTEPKRTTDVVPGTDTGTDVGRGKRHPPDLVIVARSPELEAAEQDLRFALVAVVAGTRPAV
jgi:hypothetical protein